MTLLLTVVLPWSIALLAVRLAVVVVRREKANDEPQGSLRLRPDDGTGTVRTSVVVLAVLTVLGAAALTFGGLVLDQPYDQDEMTELAQGVSSDLSDAYEQAPAYADVEMPDVEDVPSLIDDAGFDSDRVRVLRVEEQLGQSGQLGYSDVIRKRVQLVGEDGRSFACLEWRLDPASEPVERDELSVSTVGDWC